MELTSFPSVLVSNVFWRHGVAGSATESRAVGVFPDGHARDENNQTNDRDGK